MITQTKALERAGRAARTMELGRAIRPFVFPAVVSLLVLITAFLGPSGLGNSATGAPAAGARLVEGWGYLLLAPVNNVLDTLSVLTVGQHIAVLVTLILAYAAWRVLRRRSRRGWAARLGIELAAAVLAFIGLVAFYAYGALAPRPMAALVVADPDVVVVDFHSHTEHSHDGRTGFDAEDNRRWHADAGFHAVYVSDHRTWAGYHEGAAANPARAGDGTVLLPAIEIKFATLYASVLGDEWRYGHAAEGNHLIADSLYRTLREGGPRPTLVLTIPGRLTGVPRETADSIGYVAVEISDASPRGLRQSRRDRAAILRLADSLDLALVASSNNHGWGRTAAAWTLMRIPGWRDMSPLALHAAIEDKLHRERRAAAWVVERRMPYGSGSAAALALTVPAISWQMLGGLGADERVSWILWAWAAAFLIAPAVRRARRALPMA